MRLVLNIEAESAAELASVLAALAGMPGGAPAALVSADPKPRNTRSGAKAATTGADAGGATVTDPKSEPAKQDTAATTAEPSSAASGETTSNAGTTATTAASPSEGSLDPAKLKADAMTLSQKAGPQVVGELFTAAGSEKGNFSGIPVENYPQLRAAIDDLLSKLEG